MIFHYLAFFAAGALAKATDIIEGNLRGKRKFSFFTALAYGALLGWLASVSVEFATVVAAAIAAVLVAGKIDSLQHATAVVAAIAVLLFSGFPGIQIYIFPLLFALGVIDEKLNEIADETARKRKLHLAERAMGARLLMDIGAIAASATTLNPAYALAMLSSDFGYAAVSKLSGARGN